MVQLITPEEQKNAQIRCASSVCVGKEENMLKCALTFCAKTFHVSCSGVQVDKIESCENFYCKRECRENDPVIWREKYEKQKIVLQKLTANLQQFQDANLKQHEAMEMQNKKIEKLKAENARISLLEAQIKTLKESMKDVHMPKPISLSDVEDTLHDAISDEELKTSLSNVLKQGIPIKPNASSSPVRSKHSGVKEVCLMTEAEKLSYYQRLHVQRLEVPNLMKYSGDPSEWLTFKSNFERVRDKGEYDNDTMIEKLRESLIGDAEKYVKQRLNQPFASAENIMEVLKKKFFQPKEAVANALAKLENWKEIPEKNRKDLEAFLFELDNYVFLCETLKFRPELEVAINSRLTNKLPYNLELKWQRNIAENKIKGNVKELSEFLWTIVPNLPLRDVGNSSQSTSKSVKATVNLANKTNESDSKKFRRNERPKPTCWYCGTGKKHFLYSCEAFKALAYDAKLKFLATNKICSRCLSSNQHAVLNCTRVGRLPKCKIENCAKPDSHCTPMHPPSNSNQSGEGTFLHMSGIAKTMFKIVPIYVFDNYGNKIETTLLMDRAAGASLVNKEFFDKLDIQGEPYQLSLNWLQPSASHTDTNAIRHNLRIAPKYDPKRIILLNDMTALSGVILPKQEQNPDVLKAEYPYLRNAKIPKYGKQRPQILLGLPHSKWMVSLETIFDETIDSAPIAEKTPLGWTVSGSHWSSRSVFHVCEGSEDDCTHGEIDITENETLDELHETIKYFHSFDVLGIQNERHDHMSRDDATAMRIMRQTMKQVGSRYEIGLYWRDDNCKIPDNYSTAFNRLRTTEYRLKKLNLVQWANDHHKLLKDLDFVREARSDDLDPKTPHKRINYVIGFVTFNQNKEPPKARWVVDTASKHEGISLNSQLLKGPDNLIPLTQALFHFRERKFATVGDVTKMYHQILIKKEDQQAQRFLWRDCDDKREPTIYIFKSMLFGPACSPSQANSVRIDIAKKLKDKYPHGSRVALQSMYMDDEFNSEDTPEEAARAANEIIELFKTISWDSVSFRSNSEAVLKLLPPECVDNELMLELGSNDEMLNRKVLGLSWNPRKDVFIFKIAKNVEMISLTLNDNYHPTKLEVLSFIMKIFDCLGIISHFVIRGRMILQSIWRCGIGWKQQIPKDIFDAWKKWIEKFEELEKLEIPRHYGYDSRNAKNVTLHVFVDASLEAYAAIAFIRFDIENEVKVCQLMSKCRVAPVRYTSVPKLELMAALIGSRLANTIKNQHKRIKFETTTYWSDSITVLRWIYSPSLRLQQFVAPRVAEIQESTNVNEWRYVPTNMNVADDGTKWNDIDFSSSAQRWLKGPYFLYDDENEWPVKFPSDVNIEEHRVMIATLSDKNNHESLYRAGILEEVSARVRASWKHYRMTVAWMLRFMNNMIASQQLKYPYAGNNVRKLLKEIISPEELQKAEHFLFKRIQEAVFKEERIDLSKGRALKNSSKLYSLNVFLGDDGLLRAKTRMFLEESIAYDMRCPPILPNKHETVHAFLTHLHEINKHIGVEGTAAEARSQVWVLNVRGAVRRVKSRCLYCINQRARQQIPLTAPLPSFRLTPTTKAFEHCGVDCCGPFTVYAGRSYVKIEIYVVLFTCMVTRAVYLRILDSMTADEMMLAIQDIWTRRGPIRHMYSDNGGNFIGSSRIIKNDHLQTLAAEKKLTWHFIPALTPQWGGCWERLIRDVKRAMKAEMKDKVVSKKVFECILLQVEDIMNSRPLTHLPASPDDMIPLTPNYLMKLHPGYSFVQGEIQDTDEDSRLYAKRARKISDNLIKRWSKEYLSSLPHPKERFGATGLNIGDFVLYTDPQVKPSEWKKAIIVECYRGRDGFSRVADIKLLDGKNTLLKKRSVYRLAKIDIDAKYFEENENILLTTITERTLQQKFTFENFSKNVNSKTKFEFFKFRKLATFFEEMAKNSKLNIHAIIRLWNELGQAEFYTRDQVKAEKLGAAVSIGQLLAEDRVADSENRRTIKINRVPPGSNFMEIIVALAERGWTITRLSIDSVAQDAGCFAFATFEKESMKIAALEEGKISFEGRECVLTGPTAAKNVLNKKGLEYAFISWNGERLTDCCIVLTRAKDSINKNNAMPRFSGNQMDDYLKYMQQIDAAFINLVSRNPRNEMRSNESPRRVEQPSARPVAVQQRLQSVIVRVPLKEQGAKRIVSRKNDRKRFQFKK